MHVAQKLHFDVLGPTNKFFEENVGTAKRRQGFSTSLIEGWVQLFSLLHHTHTATATTHGRFHDHWKPKFLSERHGGRTRLDWLSGSTQNRNACILGQFAGGHFIAEGVKSFRGRPHKRDSRLGASPCKHGVFREKAIAWVNRIHTLFYSEFDDRVDIQIAANRFASQTHLIGFVSFRSVKAESVFVGINRHGAYAQFVSRSADTNCDFATIGDQ